MIGQHIIGKRVLIRTCTAGVHYGTLVEREGKEALLKDARRIWSWSGALSLSEIASKGVDIKNSKISVPIDEIIITEAIEYIPLHKICNLP
jgi:hypothetical protein